MTKEKFYKEISTISEDQLFILYKRYLRENTFCRIERNDEGYYLEDEYPEYSYAFSDLRDEVWKHLTPCLRNYLLKGEF